MSKSYDSQNITSFTPLCKVGKCWNISLLARLACFVVFLQAAFDSVALQNDGYAGCTPANTADSTEIHFRISSSGLDFGWDTNGVKLEGVKQRINEISAADTSLIISSLRIVGSASPEGSAKYNRLLSEKRANAVYDYLREVVSLPDSITNIEYLGRNWKGLYDLVASDPAVPSHPEVLALLRGVEKSSELSTSESNNLLYQLKRLRGGEPYIYMYRQLFPALRTSYVYVEYENRPDLGLDRVVPEETDGVGSQPADSVVAASDETDSAHCTTTDVDLPASPTLYSDDRPAVQAGKGAGKPFYMNVRTNMLFDILAVPNIGAEFYVGKNISVYANWMYSWWDSDSHHRYWRIYGGELGARVWFGDKAHAKPLTGHHIGIYGGLLTFDFEWGGTGYMGGLPGGTLWDRSLVNAGVEYGYSLPVSRNLNIDFSIGIGHLRGNYIKYFPFDNEYYIQKEYKMRFWGPTKLEVSLVWLIGRGNYNNQKGGSAR
ncbi:MAG: DUF3575 domain-containing protein [Bacteroidales bacterium]|nr:DUF3575 domain-containing protein [Bacteroidales bacterium]